MTDTAVRQVHAPTSHGNGPGAPVRRARRDRTRVAAGLVVVALSVLASATLYSRADDRVPVLAVRREVSVGHEIGAGDLEVVRVPPAAGLKTVPASEQAGLAGRVAAVTLVPGSLLAPGQVSEASPLPAGTAVVGATLAPGQHPVSLGPGDAVLLIESPSQTAAADTAPFDRGFATVLDVTRPDAATGAVTVALLVPVDAAAQIASAGAGGRLSLAVVAP